MEQVTFSPTFSQAFHYANLTGQVFWTVLAFVSLILMGVVIYLTVKDIIKGSIGTGVVVVLLFLGFLGALLSKPLSIQRDNRVTVEKSYLEKVGKPYILDSVYNNNLMIGAAVKK